MYRRTTLVLATLALAACNTDSSLVAPPQDSAPIARNDGALDNSSYLVRFGNGIPADFAARVAAVGGEVIFTHAGAGVGAVRGLTAAGATSLAASGGLQITLDDAVAIDAGIGDVESADLSQAEPTSPTNPGAAFFYVRQWHMKAIEADRAWAAGHLGSASTKVGVLDTGLDYLHPDLFGRVDLANSKSYLNSAENARVQASFPGAHPVADLHYHGTHVGATIVSNGLVAAGVTSAPTLVGFKVCAPGTAANGWRGACPTSGTLQAILDAADQGIPVINMSLGGSFLRRQASAAGGAGPSFLAVINSVFNYAYNNGTLIVVSAGNSTIDMQHDKNGYKSYCDAPHVLCVSATGPTNSPLSLSRTTATPPPPYVWENVDAIAPYSNTGGKVGVAAPGGNGRNWRITFPDGFSLVRSDWGYVYAACSGFSLPVPSCQGRFYNPANGSWSGSVLGINGTSMASPHAAGVAALAAARVGNSPAAIRNHVMGTADDLGTTGKDWYYGAGRVNAARASGM